MKKSTGTTASISCIDFPLAQVVNLGDEGVGAGTKKKAWKPHAVVLLGSGAGTAGDGAAAPDAALKGVQK